MYYIIESVDSIKAGSQYDARTSVALARTSVALRHVALPGSQCLSLASSGTRELRHFTVIATCCLYNYYTYSLEMDSMSSGSEEELELLLLIALRRRRKKKKRKHVGAPYILSV